MLLKNTKGFRFYETRCLLVAVQITHPSNHPWINNRLASNWGKCKI